MSCFSGISLLDRCEIIAITDSLALALSEGLNSDDISTLGNLLMAIGSLIVLFPGTEQDTKNP